MSPFQRTLRTWSFPVAFGPDVRHVELPHEKALGRTHHSSPRSHQVSFDAEAGGEGNAKLEGLVGHSHDFIQQGHPSQIDKDAAGGQREIEEDAAGRVSAGDHPDKYLWICDYKEARNMKIELRVTADLARDEQARQKETPVVINSGITLVCSRTGLWVLDPYNSDNVNEKGKTALGKYSDRKDGESALSKVSSTNRSTGDGKDSESSGSHGLEPSGRDESTHSKRRREDSSEHTPDVKRFKMEDKHHDRSLDIEVASAVRPVERCHIPCEHSKNNTMVLTPLHTIDHSPHWTPINCHCACVATWLVSQ